MGAEGNGHAGDDGTAGDGDATWHGGAAGDGDATRHDGRLAARGARSFYCIG